MTPKEFIKKHNLNNITINSNEMPFGELPEIIVNDADKNNLVIVYGCSDDLCVLRGAICDEIDCFDGGEITVHGKSIKIIWHDGFSKYSWTYETDIPHACFDINDPEDNVYSYCQAIVFSLDDIPITKIADTTKIVECKDCKYFSSHPDYCHRLAFDVPDKYFYCRDGKK